MSDTKRKAAKPKVVGPFEAVTPPDDTERPKVTPPKPPKPPATDMQPSDATIKRLEQMRAEQEEQKAMDRAAEISRRSSMGTLKEEPKKPIGKARGGMMYAKGGTVGSASKRADGCAMRGKTRGKMV